MEPLGDRRAAALLVRSAIASVRQHGAVRDYFETHGNWEAPMRHRFFDLRERWRAGDQMTRDVAARLLAHLNGRYATRHSSADLPHLCDATLEGLGQSGWLENEPAALLGASDESLKGLAELLETILEEAQARGCRKRPYVLATKFLHFCFPQSFAISDAQARVSMEAWAKVALDPQIHDERVRLGRLNANWMGDTSGRGYIGVLEFYRGLWDSIDDQARAELSKAAEELTEFVRAHEGARNAYVGVLDVLDKHLWHGNGDLTELLGQTPASSTP